MSNTRAVFLVIDYAPHQLTTIDTFIEKFKCDIFSISYKANNYQSNSLKHLHIKYAKNQKNDFLKKVENFRPDILIVAGWFVNDFVWIARRIRKSFNIPVVSYSDTQWTNNFRQFVNCLISPIYLKLSFSHIWVSGIYQYEYARRLGFSRDRIIFNALSCSDKFFEVQARANKNNTERKKLIFVGRFVKEKGLDLMINAWTSLSNKQGWELILIGNGPERDKFSGLDDVLVEDFIDNNQLPEIMANAHGFIITSISEQWGLVIHEAAAAGLPIIATKVCGAVPHFVHNNFNGYVVDANSKSILHALEKLVKMREEELSEFAIRSRMLAYNITPSKGVSNLIELIEKN